MAKDNNISDLNEKYKVLEYEWWMFEETYKLLSQLCENISEQAEVASTGVSVGETLTPQINAKEFVTGPEAMVTIKAGRELSVNILTEVFLLHARNIYEFFLESGDICASKLFKNEQKADWKSQKDDYIETLNQIEGFSNNFKQKINKYLSHLDKKRLKEQMLWPYPAIYGVFLKIKKSWEKLKSESK